MASVLFVVPAVTWINRALMVVALAVELFAFINCLTQRADAFPVVGAIPKGGWLAINGAAIVFTLLLTVVSIFGMIAITASAIYLLDVRPALRDALEGPGSW